MAIIKVLTNEYTEVQDMYQVISYILRSERRMLGGIGSYGVLLLSENEIFIQLLFVQNTYRADIKRRVRHLILAFERKEIRNKVEVEEFAYMMGKEVASFFGALGHQVIFAVHDRKLYEGGNLHLHILINEVNYLNGNLLGCNRTMMYNLREQLSKRHNAYYFIFEEPAEKLDEILTIKDFEPFYKNIAY